VKRIRPVRGAARGIAKSGNRFREIGLFEIGDTERIVAVGLAGVDADGLLEKIRGLAVLLGVQKSGPWKKSSRPSR